MAQATEKPIEFKLFNGGAMVFDEGAKQAAQILEIDQLGATKDKKPMLKLTNEQLATVTQALEKQGRQVELIQPKQNLVVRINPVQETATIYGKGAEIAANVLGYVPQATEKGTLKLKITLDELKDVEEPLKNEGYTIHKEDVINTQPPKAVFFESPDDTYQVFDNSARNIAKVLNLELQSTPGGRPTLSFDRQEFKEIKQTLISNHGFDTSTKDLSNELKISTYTQGDKQFGVITGNMALEAAALLGLETSWTKPTVKTGKPLPKLSLNPEQLEIAKETLTVAGYAIKLESIPELGKAANIKTHDKGGILFGEPAEQVARQFNLTTQTASSGNAMLDLDAARLKQAKSFLEAEGYTLNEQALPRNKDAASTVYINTVEDNQVIAFGQSAHQVAEALGVPVNLSQQTQKPYVKLTQEQLNTVQTTFAAQGITVDLKPLNLQAQQPKPAPKKKQAEGR